MRFELFRRLVVVVIAAFVVGPVLASSAAAETRSVQDQRHDTLAVDCRGHDCQQEFSRDRDAAFADITRFRTSYQRNRLVLTTRVLDLPDELTLVAGWDIETSRGDSLGAQVLYYGEGSAPYLIGTHGPESCSQSALGVRISQKLSTVTIVIPVRCLGRPAWVRTGADVVVDRFNPGTTWHDDAREPTELPPADHDQDTLGPRIHRG